MISYLRLSNFSRRRAVLGVAALGFVLSACSSVTDSLLKADIPDIIPPDLTQTAEGALGLSNGALDTFRNITAGDESTWLFGGLLADEWSTSSTFPQNDETDLRRIQENNGQVTSMLIRLYRARVRAAEALTALNKYSPASRAIIGEMYFAKGFAEMQLAQDFCNGIPLSTTVDGVPVPGEPSTVAQVLTAATLSYDSAMASPRAPSAFRVASGKMISGSSALRSESVALEHAAIASIEVTNAMRLLRARRRNTAEMRMYAPMA